MSELIAKVKFIQSGTVKCELIVKVKFIQSGTVKRLS